jgi:type IV secretion system protein VirB10
MPTEKVQHNFSRALDVSYGGSSSASSGSGRPSSSASKPRNEENGSDKQAEVSLLMPERPYRCRKLPGFLMIPIFYS